jgi:hypothetical protein
MKHVFGSLARACPGQRPTRPPSNQRFASGKTGRALLAKVVTPPRAWVFDALCQAGQSRPARAGRCPGQASVASGLAYALPGSGAALLAAARAGWVLSEAGGGVRAKPRCWREGPAPHTPRDILGKKKAGGV